MCLVRASHLCILIQHLKITVFSLALSDSYNYIVTVIKAYDCN